MKTTSNPQKVPMKSTCLRQAQGSLNGPAAGTLGTAGRLRAHTGAVEAMAGAWGYGGWLRNLAAVDRWSTSHWVSTIL